MCRNVGRLPFAGLFGLSLVSFACSDKPYEYDLKMRASDMPPETTMRWTYRGAPVPMKRHDEYLNVRVGPLKEGRLSQTLAALRLEVETTCGTLSCPMDVGSDDTPSLREGMSMLCPNIDQSMVASNEGRFLGPGKPIEVSVHVAAAPFSQVIVQWSGPETEVKIGQQVLRRGSGTKPAKGLDGEVYNVVYGDCANARKVMVGKVDAGTITRRSDGLLIDPSRQHCYFVTHKFYGEYGGSDSSAQLSRSFFHEVGAPEPGFASCPSVRGASDSRVCSDFIVHECPRDSRVPD